MGHAGENRLFSARWCQRCSARVAFRRELRCERSVPRWARRARRGGVRRRKGAHCLLSMRRRQARRLPCRDATRQFAHLVALPLQQAGRDRRSVAPRAVDEEWTILRQLREPLRQMIERNVHAAADELSAVARRARARRRRAARRGRPVARRPAGALMRSVVAVRSGRDCEAQQSIRRGIRRRGRSRSVRDGRRPRARVPGPR